MGRQRVLLPADLAHDDVGRLDVAVDRAARVGVVDGIADVEEAAQQFAEGERGCVSAPSLRGVSSRLTPRLTR